MPRPLRIQFSGAFYHIYNRGVNKQSIYPDDWSYRRFLSLMGEMVNKFHVELYAYCLMRNHFHLFLSTPAGNIDEAIGNLSGRFAQYVNLKQNRVGPLFQGRYKSKLVEADVYSLTLVRYIHLNPVRAGIVERLDDYAWSSYGYYQRRGSKPSWLNTQWILRQFAADEFEASERLVAYHADMVNPMENTTIEKNGSVLGSKAFRKYSKTKRGLAPF